MTPGQTTVAAVINDLFDGVSVIINGDYRVTLTSLDIEVGAHNIIPEPGTAALLGLGLAGLVIAARRRSS